MLDLHVNIFLQRLMLPVIFLLLLVVSFVSPSIVHGQSAIPQSIVNGLRKGGTDLVFGWYDSNNPSLNEFDDDLPIIAAKGGGNVRLSISMGTLENGTTGKIRDDRYQSLVGFINRAWAVGLITIVDLHNTGISEPGNPDWTDNYMWGIGNTAIEQRHTSLLIDLATRLNSDVPRDRFVIGPGNEPQYSPRWYIYQAALIPKIRSACLDCVITAFGDDWQSVAATIYNLNPSNSNWWDERVIADVHLYAPLGLTHCAYPGTTNKCPGKTWPGIYTDYLPADGELFSGTWNKALLESQLNKLWVWQSQHNVFIWFSEIGTADALIDDVKSAYLGDLISILKAHGAGWTCYEWDKNFGMYPNHPKTIAACFSGSGGPLVTPTPRPSLVPTITPTPTPRSNPSSTPLIGNIITGLMVNDTVNSSVWSVETNAQVGNTLYGDRTFTFASLPAVIIGANWIKTANASKNYTSDPLASFTLTQSATVYVSLDDRITNLPAWVSSWNDSGINLLSNGLSGTETFSLYRKTYSANTLVSLGPIANSNVSFYNVFVVPLESTASPFTPIGDVNKDGVVNGADIKAVLENYTKMVSSYTDPIVDGKFNAFDFALVASKLP
jgi:hypothetical protein